jgi:hypothetical protein
MLQYMAREGRVLDGEQSHSVEGVGAASREMALYW